MIVALGVGRTATTGHMRPALPYQSGDTEARTDLEDQLRDFHLAPAKRHHESLDHGQVEFLAGPFGEDFSRLIRRHRLAVRPVTGERVVDLGHRDDPSLQRNLRTRRRVVPRAVELVVMGEDDLLRVPRRPR